MRFCVFSLILLFIPSYVSNASSRSGEFYVIDDSVGFGRRFDGVGAISGGGVRLNYVIWLLFTRAAKLKTLAGGRPVIFGGIFERAACGRQRSRSDYRGYYSSGRVV